MVAHEVTSNPSGGVTEHGGDLPDPQQLGQAGGPGPSRRVVVEAHDDPGVGEAGGRGVGGGDAVGDAFVGIGGAEHTHRLEPRLGGHQGVGGPFAYDEYARSGRADGHRPRESRVGGQPRGGVVVLRSVCRRVEVAGLQVGDLPLGVSDG